MKMKMMVSVLCVMAVGASMAQEQMPEMGPPAELKKLDWMIGEWSGSMNWTMEGMEGEMTLALKNEWEGQFMKTTATGEHMGMTFTEVAYMAWDAKEKKLVSWTFASFAPMPRIEKGTMTGNKIVFISEPWDVPDGGLTVSRATMMKKSDTEITFVLEFQVDGSWSKVADGGWKKKPA
ncbi:MAG: hypothetical protein IH851_04200 [Armatimonadetes bacterium]|nr:hypothetical protein [Armatimonadota bacterium]